MHAPSSASLKTVTGSLQGKLSHVHDPQLPHMPCLHQGLHDPSSTYSFSVPTTMDAVVTPAIANSMNPPYCGELLCSDVALGADHCGWSTHWDGTESLAESQGQCNFEEKTKPLLAAVKIMNGTLCVPYKVNICRTSEQTTRGPLVKMGLALAAEDYEHMHVRNRAP